MASVPLKVLWQKTENFLRSVAEWWRMKSNGASSILSINCRAFRRMTGLCPQAIKAVRKPLISMSSFLVNDRGIDIGSFSMNPGILNRWTRLSRSSFNSAWGGIPAKVRLDLYIINKGPRGSPCLPDPARTAEPARPEIHDETKPGFHRQQGTSVKMVQPWNCDDLGCVFGLCFKINGLLLNGSWV